MTTTPHGITLIMPFYMAAEIQFSHTSPLSSASIPRSRMYAESDVTWEISRNKSYSSCVSWSRDGNSSSRGDTIAFGSGAGGGTGTYVNGTESLLV